MGEEQIITIKLRDTSQNAGAVPQIVRLRRLIKAALRSFGFKCLSVEIGSEQSQAKPGEKQVA